MYVCVYMYIYIYIYISPPEPSLSSWVATLCKSGRSHTSSVRGIQLGSSLESQHFHPHPHYRAPCMKYVEGSVRPICMYRPRKHVIPGP